MKVGFIGCGNMANAIIKGILTSKSLDRKDIFVTDLDRKKVEECQAEYGFNIADNSEELIAYSDVVILAVKPKIFSELLPQIDKYLSAKKPLIISIAAGKTTQNIADFLTYNASIVRVMPNINAKVCESMNGYCTYGNVSEKQEEFVNEIFKCTGDIVKIDEQYFPLFGVIAGSAPAFVYMFIDSIARSAVKNGMDKKTALNIACQTVYGSAKMIMESEQHPWELVDQVCSPGGTTIEGVLSLKNDGFESAILNAIDSSLAKDKLL